MCCQDHPHGCCAAPPPGPGSEACVIPIGNEETPRCVEAPELLVPTNTVITRCEGACTHGQVCARMRRGEEFLRISVQSDDYKTPTRVVLWRGAGEEIYRSGMIHPWYTAWPPHANSGSSGRYPVASTVAISSSLASKFCGQDDAVRLQGRWPRAL